jgi:membrane protease YdiL (CAAX protease family)
MARRLETGQLLMFFPLAYLFAWAFFLPLGLSKAGLGWIPPNLSLPVMTVLGTLCPSIAALVTLRVTTHRWPKRRHIHHPLRMAVTFLLCPLIIGAVFAMSPAILLIKGPLATLHWHALLSFSVFNCSTVIGGPIGEEPGWRGFALPRLQRLMQPSKASLFLGILWACWHLPLFLCLSWGSSSFPNYILMFAGLSVIVTFLFNFSGQSVLVAICAHAMFNTVSRWLAALLGDAPVRENLNPELIMGHMWSFSGLIFDSVHQGTPRTRKDGSRNSCQSSSLGTASNIIIGLKRVELVEADSEQGLPKHGLMVTRKNSLCQSQ